VNIRDSKFFTLDSSVYGILSSTWSARDSILKGVEVSQYHIEKYVNKVQKLQSNSASTYDEARVVTVDDVNDYEFDDSVFEVLNGYLTDIHGNKRTRMCGYIKLYSIGFFEEWQDHIARADDLIEFGVNPKTAHNIYDDITQSIKDRNALIEKELSKIINKHPILASKELEILKISTTHQLTYFINRVAKLIDNKSELRKIEIEVGALRNKFVVDRDTKLAYGFMEKYPNYITPDYYGHKGYQFSNILYKMLPESTAIAINKNTYGLCEITIS